MENKIYVNRQVKIFRKLELVWKILIRDSLENINAGKTTFIEAEKITDINVLMKNVVYETIIRIFKSHL